MRLYVGVLVFGGIGWELLFVGLWALVLGLLLYVCFVIRFSNLC